MNKMITLFFLTFSFSVLSADVISKEFYNSPSVCWNDIAPPFKSCMSEQIELQAMKSGIDFGGLKVYWIGLNVKSVNSMDQLRTSFCILNKQGYCKQAYEGIFETQNSLGWTIDYSQTTSQKFFVKSENMGRFIDFKKYKTNEQFMSLDLAPCITFFGINVDSN